MSSHAWRDHLERQGTPTMANSDQLKLLKQSVDTWNQWRTDHPEEMIDLSYADLSRADLSGANLTGANLRTANLIYARLRTANLTRADLSGATLTRADLSGATLSEVNLSRANLRDVTGITPAELETSALLADATMPDGSTHR